MQKINHIYTYLIMNHVGYRIISSDVGTRRRVVGRQAAAEIRFTASDGLRVPYLKSNMGLF